MPKKTTILIVILAIITGILIVVAIRSDQTQEFGKKLMTNGAATATPVVIRPYASLYFSTPLIDITRGTTAQAVDIMVDAKDKSVAGAQVELTYDPTVITNVTLTPLVPNQFFGKNPIVLINSVDKTQGRISYAISISLNDSEKTGRGSIGQLSFTVNKFSGVPSTRITFLPKSAVTTQATKFSVLDTTTPLQIVLAPSATATPR
jgi:hypothetical protein